MAHEVAYGDELWAWIWNAMDRCFYPVAYFDWNKSICGRRSPAVVCNSEPGRPKNCISWPCDPTEVCYRFENKGQLLEATARMRERQVA